MHNLVSASVLFGCCLAACGSDPNPIPSDPVADARPPDASTPPDAPFFPVRACATNDLSMTPVAGTRAAGFYNSTFYPISDTALYRLRGTAAPLTLVVTGQPYPPGGPTAQVRVLRYFLLPSTYRACPEFTPLALQGDYLLPGRGGDFVALVDDLTGDLTQVVASGETYAGAVITRVHLLAQSDCGDLALQLSLADGRNLLVRRDAVTGTMKTLLGVAPPGGIGGGDPIAGTSGRYFGYVDSVTLAEDNTLLRVSVDSGAPARLGSMRARIDDTSGDVSCQVTDTDVPCQLTSNPDQTGYGWAHGGDTIATAAGQIVRGGIVAPSVPASSGVRVCRTGEVYMQRRDRDIAEIFIVRRDNSIQRVTRFGELARSGEPTANYIQSFRIGPACELVVDAGDARTNTFGRWIHWADGTIGKVADGYNISGFDANDSVGLRALAGDHAIARKPANCIAPPPQ